MISERSRGYVLGAIAAAQLRTESALCAAALRRGPGSGFRAVLPLCAGCGDAGCADAVPAAVVRPAAARRPAACGYGRALLRLVAAAFRELQPHGRRHRLDDPVRLSGDGRGHHGRGFPRAGHRRHGRLDRPGVRGHLAALQRGRRRDAQPRGRRAGLPFGALLCGLDRRRQPARRSRTFRPRNSPSTVWFSARWSMSFGCGAVPICNPSLRL